MSHAPSSTGADSAEEDFRAASWRDGVQNPATPYHETVVHALAEAARREESVGVTVLPDREDRPPDHLSYRDVYHRAHQVAAGLRSAGLGNGDRVLLVMPTNADFAPALFGIQLVGAIPVPACPPSGFKIEAGLRRLAHIANHAGTKLCVTSKTLSRVIGDLAMRVPVLREIVCVEDIRESSPLDPSIRCSSDQIGLLQYTSGSTGNPKGVGLTHHNLAANVHAIGQALQITRSDRYCGWCPLFHDMGLIGQLLFPVYWRIPVTLLSPLAFLSKPVRWLRAITEQGATLSTAPNFGYALTITRTKPHEREGLDLRSWRVAMNGAEPVQLTTMEAFRDTYAAHGFSGALLPVYGLAEASLAVTFPSLDRPLHYERVDRRRLIEGRAVPSSDAGVAPLVSVGMGVPGHGVIVVDADGRPIPEREIGHIVATGPSIMRGYWDDPRATEEVLRDGRLWTGDLGYLADGQLFIAGRAKDVIIIRGSNYYPEDIEQGAETVEGVRPGGVVAFGIYDDANVTESVVLVCETRAVDREERRRIADRVRDSVQEVCAVVVDEVVLVEPRTIPKTSSGKRQRSLCKRLYLEDRLTPARLGKLELAFVLLRSQAGYLWLHARKLMGRR